MNLKRHAEVVKLAGLLAIPTEQLHYLEKLSLADLRALRERATDRIYDSDDRFNRIAFIATLPPVGLTAWIAEHIFGALLCARIAGRLPVKRAVALADRMQAYFLASLAAELDPRRASAIIAGLPPELVGEVAGVMTQRSNWVEMGRFVGHMTDDAIKESLLRIDEASLLRISYVLEEDDGLERVIALMSQRRIRATIRAATEADLWAEALDLLERVPRQRAGTLADLAAEEDDSVLDAMVATAQRDGLWESLLPLLRVMSEDSRRRFATLPAIHDPDVLRAIVDVAIAGDLWPDVLPLISLLPQHPRGIVLGRILEIADTTPDQERLLPLAESMPADLRAQLVSLARSREMLDRLGPLRPALSGP